MLGRMTSERPRSVIRVGRWFVLIAALALLFFAGATAVPHLFWKEDPAYRCVSQAQDYAPSDVLPLSEAQQSSVRGELTLIPLGLRCGWPADGRYIWTDDGWARTVSVYGGAVVSIGGLIAFARTRSE